MLNIKITVTPDEKKALIAAASKLGLPLATYIRMSALQAARK